MTVLIDNIYYKSMRDVAKVFNINKNTISKRIKSIDELYNNYQYATINNDDYVKNICIRPVIIDNIYYNWLDGFVPF
jgi:hypothetical protein